MGRVSVGWVDAAVDGPGAEMSPASGSFGFAWQNGRRAAVAADRCETLRVERVDDDVVLLDVGFQVVVVEFGQWVDSDGVRFDIDRQDRADASLAAVTASKAADERVVLVSDLAEWLDFPSVAALFLAF